MIRYPIDVSDKTLLYSTIWDKNLTRYGKLILEVYSTKRSLQSWANGRYNPEHWLGVL